MSGIDELSKYLKSIFDTRNRSLSTEHRSVQTAKTVSENTQSGFDYDISSVIGEFGYAAGYVTYADSFPRFLFPEGVHDHPLIARPLISGYIPPNLVSVNSGFEIGGSGVFGWTTGGGLSISTLYDEASFTEGIRSVQVTFQSTTTNDSGYLYQDLKDIRDWGKSVRIEIDRFFVSRTSAELSTGITIEAFDHSGASLGNIHDVSFTALDGSFTSYKATSDSPIPSGTYKLRLYLKGKNASAAGGNNGVVRWDNVKIFILPPVTLPICFGRNTVGKENYQVGAGRAFDFFARNPSSSSLGQGNDFRRWTAISGIWATDIYFDGKSNVAYNAYVATTSGGLDHAYIDYGSTTNIVLYTLIEVGSANANAGLIFKYEDSANYAFAILQGSPGGSTTLTLDTILDGVAQGSTDSSSFSTTAGKSYLLVVVLDGNLSVKAYVLGDSAEISSTISISTNLGALSGTKHGICGNNITSTSTKWLQWGIMDSFWRGSSNIVVNQSDLENSIKSSSASASHAFMDLNSSPERVNYRIRVDTLPTGTDEAGLTFRAKNARNYWKFIASNSTNTYKIIPVINNIDGHDVCTDTRKIGETYLYVTSTPDGFSAAVGDPYYDEVLYDSPLCYYRLGDAAASASAKDSSGFANHGTYPSANISSEPGALLTDGNRAAKISVTTKTNNISATVANLPLSLDSRSIECWFSPTDSTSLTNAGICGYGSGGAAQFGLYYSKDGNQKFGVSIGTVFFESTSSFSPGSFYHVVATYSGGDNIKLYVNGVLENDTTSVSLVTNSTAFLIYGVPEALGLIRKGIMDEVALYRKALSLGRIIAHYNAGRQHFLSVAGPNNTLDSRLTYDSHLLGNRTGFGMYIKGTSPRLRYPMVSHSRFDSTYKDFAFYSEQKRLA